MSISYSFTAIMGHRNSHASNPSTISEGFLRQIDPFGLLEPQECAMHKISAMAKSKCFGVFLATDEAVAPNERPGPSPRSIVLCFSPTGVFLSHPRTNRPLIVTVGAPLKGTGGQHPHYL